MDKIKGNADIVMAFEDNTFSNGKFLIDSFNGLIRLDKKKNGSKALRCGSFSKNIEKKHLCCHDKNYSYFCKSNINVINLIRGSIKYDQILIDKQRE